MNIRDATFYFLNNKYVKKVYGFEPFKIHLNPLRKIGIYLNDTNRLEIFKYGISNENNKWLINFNTSMICGQSTLKNIRDKVYLSYIGWELVE